MAASSQAEVDLDQLLETSFSQGDSSLLLPDLDTILQPLSNSQQMREEDLDQMDESIRNMEVKEKEKLEQQEVELHNKHQVKQSKIRRHPPGLAVFKQPREERIFGFSDLSLEEDFGWRGRNRLRDAGVSEQQVRAEPLSLTSDTP